MHVIIWIAFVAIVTFLLLKIRDLDKAITAKEIDERFDGVYRNLDERLERLERETVTGRETLERELRTELTDHGRYNDVEFDQIRARLDKLE